MIASQVATIPNIASPQRPKDGNDQALMMRVGIGTDEAAMTFPSRQMTVGTEDSVGNEAVGTDGGAFHKDGRGYGGIGGNLRFPLEVDIIDGAGLVDGRLWQEDGVRHGRGGINAGVGRYVDVADLGRMPDGGICADDVHR